jgi:hypothetical protein
MIGLFLPRQRVVLLQKLQCSSPLLDFDGPLQRHTYLFSNGSLTPARNFQQDGGRDVSASI